MSKNNVTPSRQQYLDLKAQHPDCILFFRLGDFYETFDEDAELCARELDLALTKRHENPMAGVPYHSADTYIAQLVAKGYKVAVAEQIGDPGAGLMERKVMRVVTAGTLTEPTMLDARRNNYLVALLRDEKEGQAGLAYVDISTGEFACTQLGGRNWLKHVDEELDRLAPAEVIEPLREEEPGTVGPRRSQVDPRGFRRTPFEGYHWELGRARRALEEHFGVMSLESFGCADKPLAVRAAGAALAYVRETQRRELPQLERLVTYSMRGYMTLDAATRRNLELTEAMRGGVKGSLLGVLDETQTAMGARLLRQWLGQPLLRLDILTARLDAVEAFYQNTATRMELGAALKEIADIERLTNRAITGTAQPRDMGALRASLERVPELQLILTGLLRAGLDTPPEPLHPDDLDRCPEMLTLLTEAIVDEPPAVQNRSGFIRPTFSQELSEIIEKARHARDWIGGLQETERQRTGITSLKVSYNKVFGYYIEVSNANTKLVPKDYERRQTLVNAERYVTTELKEYEALVLNAEERQLDLEQRIFAQVLQQVAAASERLLGLARALAHLDAFVSFAEVAVRHRYVRPTLTTDKGLHIEKGRHPVVELTLKDEPYIPNNTDLTESACIHIITGANMTGKCARGGTLIFTERGVMSLDQLKPAGAHDGEFTALNVGVRGREGLREATHFYSGGRQKTIRLKTKLGFCMEGTAEHRVWVRFPDGSEGWKCLGEVEMGDVVAIERHLDLWGNQTEIPPNVRQLRVEHHTAKNYPIPTHLDERLGYVMGLLTGDGTMTRHQNFLLTSKGSPLGSDFTQLIHEIFGCVVCVARGRDYVVGSTQLRLLLAGLGMGYWRAHEKQVPHAILRAPKSIVAAYLQGLFDTDGYTAKKYGNVELSTASERLAHEVQMLLLNFGIIASHRVKKTKCRPAHLVGIDGEDAIRFHQEIGFRLPYKQVRADLASSVRRPNKGGIPHLAPLLKQIHTRIVATPNKPVSLHKNKHVESIFHTYIPNKRNISYAKLDELIAYCHESGVPCPELEAIRDTHYFYDYVKRIEAGEGEVYDLSVATDHAYIANGFVSHNSTYMRQTALIVLMAQLGSFVPAEQAEIGMVDRIFTRVGAQDEIARGQSTFMVEMVETANLLSQGTNRSLFLLDEVGRGTSTYDGLAIARAVVEYIHNHPNLQTRTLFATHYHELTVLESLLPRVKNYRVAVAEEGDKVIFLHKVEPGGADRSYGIYVAQIAGLPKPVIARAREILAELERERGNPSPRPDTSPAAPQLPLFAESQPSEVERRLREVDVLALTPIEALTLLFELQTLAKQGDEGEQE